MFHRIIFLSLIFRSLFCNLNRCAVCFQSFMNIACRSTCTQNVARIKRFSHCTKNWIYTDLLSVNMVQKVQTRRKLKAKMVNTAFACQFTWGCKFQGKCGIYHLCPLFNLSLHFLCTKFALSKFSVNPIFRAVSRLRIVIMPLNKKKLT